VLWGKPVTNFHAFRDIFEINIMMRLAAGAALRIAKHSLGSPSCLGTPGLVGALQQPSLHVHQDLHLGFRGISHAGEELVETAR